MNQHAPWQADWYHAMTASQKAKQRNIAKFAPGKRITIAKAPKMATWMDRTAGTGTATTTIDTFDLYNNTTTGGNMYVTSTASSDTWLISNSPPTGTYVTQQAQQRYGPPPPQPVGDPRILNRYLNAADLLEEFITDLAPLGVKQGEALEIPIELFINWLICKAADEDGHDAPSDIEALPAPTSLRPRCKCCGRYIKVANAAHGLQFCNGEHADRYLERIAA